MREIGIKLQILTSFDVADNFVQSIAGDAVEGAIFSAPLIQEETPVVRDFEERYKNKYGSPPEFYAAYGYDVLKMIALAFGKVGHNPEKVRESLLQIKGFPGILGEINVSPNGDCETPLTIKVIKNRTAVPYQK